MTLIEVICSETNKTFKYKYINDNKNKIIQSHGYCYLGCRNYIKRELSDTMGLEDNRKYRRYAINNNLLLEEKLNIYIK